MHDEPRSKQSHITIPQFLLCATITHSLSCMIATIVLFLPQRFAGLSIYNRDNLKTGCSISSFSYLPLWGVIKRVQSD